MEKLVSLSPFYLLSMLKDDLKLSSSEDSDGEQVCSWETQVPEKYTECIDSLLLQQCSVIQQQTEQLKRRICNWDTRQLASFQTNFMYSKMQIWGKSSVLWEQYICACRVRLWFQMGFLWMWNGKTESIPNTGLPLREPLVFCCAG